MLPKLFLGDISRRLLGIKLTNWIAKFAIARWVRFPGAWWASQRAERAVDRILSENFSERPSRSRGESENVVWQIWLQGWTNAPDIVRAIQEHNDFMLPGFHFKRLSLQGALKLVKIAPEIIDHFNSGRISPAGLTDLLRLKIIAAYGGIWADATVILTRAFSSFYRENKRFLLQSDYEIETAKRWHFTVHNWLFSAEDNDEFILLWGDALEEMWRKNGQVEYFDAFYVATALQKRGTNPTNYLSRSASSSYLKGGISTFSSFLRVDSVGDAKALLSAHPFHKFSHKVEFSEEARVVEIIRLCG